jgi:Uma2 family endonuclease
MASATTSTPETTAVELVQNDLLYEVIDGRIVETPPMGAFEGDIASRLLVYLGSFVRAHRLGRAVVEVLFLLDSASNLQYRPDVAFVSAARWPGSRRVPSAAAWEVVPDLAIEVVSPTNLVNEVMAKVRNYFRVGVQRVWVILPNESLVYLYQSPTSVQILKVGDEIDGGDLLPGFRLPVATLFEDLAD